MKLDSFFSRNSLFNRLLIVMACLVTLSMAFSAGVIFYIRAAWKDEMLLSHDSYISAWSETVDASLESISNAFIYLSRSEEIQRRAQNGYFQRNQTLKNDWRIIDQLNTVTITATGVNDAFLYWYDSPTLYTRDGTINAEVYYNNRFSGDFSQWDNLLRGVYNKATVVLCPTERSLEESFPNNGNIRSAEMYMVQTIKNFAQQPVGSLCIAMDTAILRTIFPESSFAETREIYILNHSGDLLLSNASEEQWNRLQSQIDLDSLTNGSRFFSGSGLISHYLSQFGDLEYVVFTDSDLLMQKINRSFLIVLLVEGMFIAILLLCSIAASRRLSLPFQRLLSVMGASQSDRAENEIAFLTNRVLELIHSNKTMTSTFAGSSHAVLQAVLYKTIIGAPSVEESLAVAGSYRNIPLSGPETLYQTAVVRIDLPVEQDEVFHSEHRESFARLLRDHLDNWLLDILDTSMDEYTLVFCLRSQREEQEIFAALRRILSELRKEVAHSTLYIGIGTLVDSIRNLKISYDAGLDHLRKRPVQSAEAIWGENDTTPCAGPWLPEDMEERIRDFLAKGQEEPLTAYISHILEQNWNANVNYESYLFVCCTINDYLLRVRRFSGSGAPSDLIRISASKYVYSAAKCNEVIFSNLKQVLDHAKASIPGDAPPLADQLRAYLDQHYRENINLNIVANTFGYSPTYVSRIFKMKCGINFTDYLNACRITAAKEILCNSQKPLKDIAQEVGLTGATLFIRIFEKYEGCTPGEWRRRIQQQKKGAVLERDG